MAAKILLFMFVRKQLCDLIALGMLYPPVQIARRSSPEAIYIKGVRRAEDYTYVGEKLTTTFGAVALWFCVSCS